MILFGEEEAYDSGGGNSVRMQIGEEGEEKREKERERNDKRGDGEREINKEDRMRKIAKRRAEEEGERRGEERERERERGGRVGMGEKEKRKRNEIERNRNVHARVCVRGRAGDLINVVRTVRDRPGHCGTADLVGAVAQVNDLFLPPLAAPLCPLQTAY